jgi:hypothetical protein
VFESNTFTFPNATRIFENLKIVFNRIPNRGPSTDASSTGDVGMEELSICPSTSDSMYSLVDDEVDAQITGPFD